VREQSGGGGTFGKRRKPLGQPQKSEFATKGKSAKVVLKRGGGGQERGL